MSMPTQMLQEADATVLRQKLALRFQITFDLGKAPDPSVLQHGGRRLSSPPRGLDLEGDELDAVLTWVLRRQL